MQDKTDTFIPNDIRLWRRKRGYNQRRFAKELGINRSRISLWEQGRTLPSWENLNKITELLLCQASQLYRDGRVLGLLSDLQTER